MIFKPKPNPKTDKREIMSTIAEKAQNLVGTLHIKKYPPKERNTQGPHTQMLAEYTGQRD